MKRNAIMIILSVIFTCSCSYSRFVLTGNTYPSLPSDSTVKVIAWEDEGKYDVIGIVEIGESSISSRIEEAKRLARKHGGDAILPKGKEGQGLEANDTGYLLQNFMVLRKKEKEPAIVENITEESLPKHDMSYENTNLPRATYKLLLEEYESLRGEKFRGSLFPTKFFKIPAEIDTFAKGNKKLLQLKTKSGSKMLLLLVPKDNTRIFSKMIKSKEKLNFVYTPVTVYKSKYPVLEFLAVIE